MYKLSNNTKISISDTRLGSGGQGDVYKITRPMHLSNKVVKIYHTPKEALKNKNRIEYMLRQNPVKNKSETIKSSFAWPEDLVFDSTNQYVGYMMPLVDNAIDLYELTVSNKNRGSVWHKFQFSSPEAQLVRLKLLYNLAQAYEVLEASKHYRIVDMKPPNIKVTPVGKMIIIDTDSFQIHKNGRVLFPTGLVTEDYCPPEFRVIKSNGSNTFIEPYWDYFSFGIIAYQLLFGIHPYVGSHPKYTTIADMIKIGVWAHSKKRSGFLVIPPPHIRFTKIAQEIQQLFFRCFDDGHNTPHKRPNYNEWISVLIKEIHKEEGLSGRHKVATSPTVNRPYVTVPEPKIVRLNIQPGTTNNGILNWCVDNASQVLINGQRYRNNGQLNFDANQRQTFNLHVDHISKSVSQSIVFEPLEIKQFFYYTKNNQLYLSWSIKGRAASVKINGKNIDTHIQEIHESSMYIRDFTIEVTDQYGFIYTKNLHVSKLVIINYFSFSPPNSKNNHTILRWDVKNAVSVKINGVPYSFTGSKTIPLEKQTYTLIAIDQIGETANQSVTVAVQPQIKQFEIKEINKVPTLRWNVLHAKEIRINGVRESSEGVRTTNIKSGKYQLVVLGYDGSYKRKDFEYETPLLALNQVMRVVKGKSSFNKIRNTSSSLMSSNILVKRIKQRCNNFNKIGKLRGGSWTFMSIIRRMSDEYISFNLIAKMKGVYLNIKNK